MDRVRRADFPVVLRGYDRSAVDAYVADVAQLVAELEATQLPETVVQRALDEVGGETSAILKRAHEAGEDITARSRAQAESRLERAEHEAEQTRKEATDQVRRLEEDIGSIWQERQRLIEDIRTLADDVLALADDAMDRVPPPGDGREERAAAAAAAQRAGDDEGPARGDDDFESEASGSGEDLEDEEPGPGDELADEEPGSGGAPPSLDSLSDAGVGGAADEPLEEVEAPEEEEGPADQTLSMDRIEIPDEEDDTAERRQGDPGS